jgi:hypothetical protein
LEWGGESVSKPKKYGLKTGYIPNAKADMRYCKKVYQRGREKAFQNVQDQRRRESEDGK